MAPSFDVLIIGTGLAGPTLALHVAGDRRVGLVTKKELLDGASSWPRVELPRCRPTMTRWHPIPATRWSPAPDDATRT